MTVTAEAHHRMHLQALADLARGRMQAAGESARQAAHSYAAAHVAAGDEFVAAARGELAASATALDRLARLGREVGSTPSPA